MNLMTSTLYDAEKWDDILSFIEKDENYAKLTPWEKQFMGRCLGMNDKRIALSGKQCRILEVIYGRLK